MKSKHSAVQWYTVYGCIKLESSQQNNFILSIVYATTAATAVHRRR